ncbi:MAG: alpha-galactosidase [Planctomycetota bacterium]
MSMIRKLRPLAPRFKRVARYWATSVITYILALTFATELTASERTFVSPPSSSGSHDSLKSVWPVRFEHGFHQALEHGIGFSFVLDGQLTGPAVPADSDVTTGERDGVHETVFRHPLGLAAVRQCRAFPQFDALEYTIKLRNDSAAELPILENVNALDVSFRGQTVEGSSVVSCGGGGADSRFPPKDYALARNALRSTNRLTLSSEGGYPSNSSMPFFFIENETARAGIYVAIGWTGNWNATIEADSSQNTLRIHGGMPKIHVKLRPSEEISGPTVLIGCYQGRLEDGANALRRVIRHCYTPSVAGRPLVAPIMYTTWFHVGAELDEKMARALVDAAAEVGQEIFEVDAGWYKGTPYSPYWDMRNTWPAISNPLGNWELGEERSRFPSGLEDLAEYARSKGMQFGLWFELERVGPDSLLARRHPDWIIKHGDGWRMADFGNPEVQDYFSKILDRYIRTLKLAYIRWDCNLHDIDAFWATQDSPDRRGMSEIRHVEGIRRVEQFVRDRHPNVILESCASGGRRIDLVTLRNRHTTWISDATAGASIIRFHLEGLNHLIPGSRQLVAFAPAERVFAKLDLVFPDIDCQCCFAGAFGTAGKLHLWPEAMKRRMRQHVGVYKKLRHYLAEDFYLLIPQSQTLDTWAAWQFHDPRASEGFVQPFRIESAQQSKKIVLKGLDSSGEYQFTDPYNNDTFTTASGAELISIGLELSLPKNSSRVLTYRKTK